MVQVSWAETLEPHRSCACAKRGHNMLWFATRHLEKAETNTSVHRGVNDWEVIREMA
jgi:hypothetical protein